MTAEKVFSLNFVRLWRNVAHRINHNEQERTIEDNERASGNFIFKEGFHFFLLLSYRCSFRESNFSFQFHYQNQQINSHTHEQSIQFGSQQQNCFSQSFHENNFPETESRDLSNWKWVLCWRATWTFRVKLQSFFCFFGKLWLLSEQIIDFNLSQEGK